MHARRCLVTSQVHGCALIKVLGLDLIELVLVLHNSLLATLVCMSKTGSDGHRGKFISSRGLSMRIGLDICRAFYLACMQLVNHPIVVS